MLSPNPLIWPSVYRDRVFDSMDSRVADEMCGAASTYHAKIILDFGVLLVEEVAPVLLLGSIRLSKIFSWFRKYEAMQRGKHMG